MIKRNTDLYGCVLAHKWFSDGEGWSFHPHFTTIIRELTEPLQQELQNRNDLSFDRWNSFCVSTKYGNLWGIQKGDSGCHDERAIGRYPTILLAVLLPKGSSPPTELKSYLEPLIPKSRGIDEGLHILIHKLQSNSRKWSRYWILSGVLLMSFLILSGIILFSSLNNYRSDIYDKHKDVLLNKMKDALIEIPVEWDKKQRPEKFEYFFANICPIDISNEDIQNATSIHPDYKYLKLLKNIDFKIQTNNNNSSWQSYISDLNSFKIIIFTNFHFLETDNNDIHVSATGEEASAFFEQCMNSIKYCNWFSKEFQKDNDFRKYICTGNNNSDKGARTIAYHYTYDLTEFDNWQVNVAKRMYLSLENWKVKEINELDTERRPMFVIQMYFAFLNRERFSNINPDGSISDISIYEDFIKRLPDDNFLKKHDFSNISQRQVNNYLTELLKLITKNNDYPLQDYASAIALIEEQLNYRNWKKQRQISLKKERDSFERDDPIQYILLNKKLEAKELSDDDRINIFVKRFIGEDKDE